MKFQTQSNFNYYEGFTTNDDDITIPGQSVTVRQIVFNAVNGLPINCSHYQDSEIDQYDEYFDLQDENNKNQNIVKEHEKNETPEEDAARSKANDEGVTE